MNGLSDSVTIGIVLALVFGALFFYIYSRVTQNEKRVSLIENMGELIKIVGGPSIEDKIIPAVSTLAADKTWRIRLAAV